MDCDLFGGTIVWYYKNEAIKYLKIVESYLKTKRKKQIIGHYAAKRVAI